jgi:hypothetical protein
VESEPNVGTQFTFTLKIPNYKFSLPPDFIIDEPEKSIEEEVKVEE